MAAKMVEHVAATKAAAMTAARLEVAARAVAVAAAEGEGEAREVADLVRVRVVVSWAMAVAEVAGCAETVVQGAARAAAATGLARAGRLEVAREVAALAAAADKEAATAVVAARGVATTAAVAAAG